MPQKSTSAQNNELQPLELLLGHRFVRIGLLEQALTHSSLRHELQMTSGNGSRKAPKATAKVAPKSAAKAGIDPENTTPSAESPLQTGLTSGAGEPAVGDNERFEFLGDAVVGMLVAEGLFRRFPTLREGELTRLRAALVSRKHLGEVGEALELGRWLRMGKSEEKNGGRMKAVLLANCVEAIAAALYLDSGDHRAAAKFVETHIMEPQVDTLYREMQANHSIGDYKSALQEFLQAGGGGQPEYQVLGESGPDHRKRFLVEVRTAAADEEGGRALAQGSGSTKKKAEQEAARRAFRRLGGEPENGTGEKVPGAPQAEQAAKENGPVAGHAAKPAKSAKPDGSAKARAVAPKDGRNGQGDAQADGHARKVSKPLTDGSDRTPSRNSAAKHRDGHGQDGHGQDGHGNGARAHEMDGHAHNGDRPGATDPELAAGVNPEDALAASEGDAW